MKSRISRRPEMEQLISKELKSIVPGFDIDAHASGTNRIHEPILTTTYTHAAYYSGLQRHGHGKITFSVIVYYRKDVSRILVAGLLTLS